MSIRDSYLLKIISLPDVDFIIDEIRNEHAESLLMHQVAAWMLFPSDNAKKTRQAYITLGTNAVLLQMLEDMEMPIEKAFVTVCHFLLPLYKLTNKIEPDKDSLDLRRDVRVAWSTYQEHLRHANFPKEGKGSIAERTMRGQLAGLLLSIALLEKISLSKAANLLVEQMPEIKATLPSWLRKHLPTVTQDNLLRNIWPEFKSVAHIWTGLQDFRFDVTEDPKAPYLLNLMDILELEPALWSTRWQGWRNLVHKSNFVLHSCVAQGPTHKAAQPLLSYESCIRLVIR